MSKKVENYRLKDSEVTSSQRMGRRVALRIEPDLIKLEEKLAEYADLGVTPDFSIETTEILTRLFLQNLVLKMIDAQNFDDMPLEDRIRVLESMKEDLKTFMWVYTNIDIELVIRNGKD